MKKIRTWYAGRRVSKKETLIHGYQMEGDKELRFYTKPLVPALIGECWLVSRDDSGLVYTGSEHRPERGADGDDWGQKTCIPHIAQDTAACEMIAELKGRRQLAKRKTEFEQVMAPLLELYNTLPNLDARSAFIQAVTKHLIYRSK